MVQYKEYKISVYEKILTKILNFISYKLRSEKEITSRLDYYLRKEKKSSEEKNIIREKILNQLKTDGYINDLKLVDVYKDSISSSNKRRSVRVLRKTLENKGLGEGEVSKIINSLPEDYEKTRAIIDAKRKLNKLSNIPIYIKRSKITSYLYSKGYSPDTVRFVVDSILTLQ